MESLLATTDSVAYARFGSDGVLSAANARFLGVCGAGDGEVRLPELVVEGQRELMMGLLGGDDVPAGRRMVHFAERGNGAPVSLQVSWARDGDDLVLVGEPPSGDAEASQAMLLKLNRRVAELARENAKKSAQLERALEDLRQAQAMLVHREKMTALGQMTAGVAHELNNPLAYVRNNLYLLDHGVDALFALINLIGENLDGIEASQPILFDAFMDLCEGIDLPRLADQIPQLLTSAKEGVERAVGLVARLRTFSRLDEAVAKTVDLNESLSSVVEFVGFLLDETGTELVVDWGQLPPVTCSPGPLNQAVLNIVTNAVQAASPGGRVALSTRLDGDEVLIRVEDDGPGVPEDLADRVFDPFFTTRGVGEGTGLGLSIADTVVAGHGGTITLERSAEGGAAFTIRLPVGREVSS